jgi:hypothetical protein
MMNGIIIGNITVVITKNIKINGNIIIVNRSDKKISIIICHFPLLMNFLYSYNHCYNH